MKLGPGNDEAAKKALKTWPGGLQVAGGITDKNAQYWIDQGAEKVDIVLTPLIWNLMLIILSGYYHLISVPGGQILSGAARARPCCSWRRQVEAGVGSELPEKG